MVYRSTVVQLADVPELRDGVPVAYLATFVEMSDLRYLQAIRTGTLAIVTGGDGEQHSTAISYHSNERRYARMLAEAFDEAPIDLIVSPPSSRQDAAIYRAAFHAVHRKAVDLTDALKRRGLFSAGAGATVEDLAADLVMQPHMPLGSFSEVLIVDDIVRSGRTLAAVMRTLRAAGLSIEARFSVAAPLFMA